MEVDGIEINELNPVTGKKKQIILGILGIVAIAIILFIIINWSQPTPLSVSFTDSKIRAGSSTELVVEFRNLGNKDLHNVEFRITPENQNIVVNNSQWTENTIGAGAYRKLVFPVKAKGNLTQGTYRITVEVRAGDQDYTKNVYLEIAD